MTLNTTILSSVHARTEALLRLSWITAPCHRKRSRLVARAHLLMIHRRWLRSPLSPVTQTCAFAVIGQILTSAGLIKGPAGSATPVK